MICIRTNCNCVDGKNSFYRMTSEGLKFIRGATCPFCGGKGYTERFVLFAEEAKPMFEQCGIDINNIEIIYEEPDYSDIDDYVDDDEDDW